MLLHLIQHAYAADYQLLAPIPQLTTSGSFTNFNTYLPALVKLIIAVAGGLAVIRIIVGGIRYMSTDAFTGKSSAKETIQNALIGLLLAISAYAILYTVNPNLVNINFALQNVKQGGDINTGLGSSGTQTAEQTGCTSDCVPLNLSVGSGAACSNTPCYVSSDLEKKLGALQTEIGGQVAWQVSEAFPPLLTDAAPCYTPGSASAGTCISTSLSVPTSANLNIFFTALGKVGLTSYIYNVCGQRLVDFQADSGLSTFKSRLQCISSSRPEATLITAS